jgi:DNA repair exonuclease SbcCD ATPase subunit
MTNKTSASSDLSASPEAGATDLQWPPSWWRWLIFALSGTVEIEKQAALQEQRHRQRMSELRKSDEELRKSDEELRKIDEELRIQHEQRLSELKKENARLAELESKIDGLFSKYNINLTPEQKSGQP